jgi:hypothetical protein
MEMIVDWSQKRQKHILERMMLRGISKAEFYNALAKGRKRIQDKNTIEAFYSYYSIVYEEVRTKEFTKIYPITVKVML